MRERVERSECNLGKSYGTLKAMIKDWDFILNAKGRHYLLTYKTYNKKIHISPITKWKNGLDRTRMKAEISFRKTLL